MTCLLSIRLFLFAVPFSFSAFPFVHSDDIFFLSLSFFSLKKKKSFGRVRINIEVGLSLFYYIFSVCCFLCLLSRFGYGRNWMDGMVLLCPTFFLRRRLRISGLPSVCGNHDLQVSLVGLCYSVSLVCLCHSIWL